MVKLDGVPVPALVEGRRISVVTGGGGVVTIEYVPRLVDVGGVPAVNITTQDLLLIWANGPLIVMSTVKILNFTRLDHSIVIVARGPGYLVYAVPLANAATQKTTTAARFQTTVTQVTSASAVPISYTTTTRQESPQPFATTTTTVPTSSSAVSPQTTPPTQAAQPGVSAPGAFDVWWSVAAAAAGVAVAYLGRRRPVELGEVDAKILEYVRRRGGAYEAEVARELGIPRTTVFRAVRRLEERGLVRVEKREGRNWVAPAG